MTQSTMKAGYIPFKRAIALANRLLKEKIVPKEVSLRNMQHSPRSRLDAFIIFFLFKFTFGLRILVFICLLPCNCIKELIQRTQH